VQEIAQRNPCLDLYERLVSVKTKHSIESAHL